MQIKRAVQYTVMTTPPSNWPSSARSGQSVWAAAAELYLEVSQIYINSEFFASA